MNTNTNTTSDHSNINASSSLLVSREACQEALLLGLADSSTEFWTGARQMDISGHEYLLHLLTQEALPSQECPVEDVDIVESLVLSGKACVLPESAKAACQQAMQAGWFPSSTSFWKACRASGMDWELFYMTEWHRHL